MIEQAKGVLAGRTGVGVGVAVQLLRTHARDKNLALDDVSRRLVDGRLSLETLSGGQSRSR